MTSEYEDRFKFQVSTENSSVLLGALMYPEHTDHDLRVEIVEYYRLFSAATCPGNCTAS